MDMLLPMEAAGGLLVFAAPFSGVGTAASLLSLLRTEEKPPTVFENLGARLRKFTASRNLLLGGSFTASSFSYSEYTLPDGKLIQTASEPLNTC